VSEVHSAHQLLERQPDPEYLEGWRRTLSTPPSDPVATRAFLEFELNEQRFGVQATSVRQVLEKLSVRAIPNRPARLLQGLVNFQGRLQLCVSLAQLLEVSGPEPTGQHLVLDFSGELYIAAVCRVLGIRRVPVAEIQPAPQAALHLEGICQHQGTLVRLLDAEALSASLRRGVAR
jgi:chemotaxis signal transduction protein